MTQARQFATETYDHVRALFPSLPDSRDHLIRNFTLTVGDGYVPVVTVEFDVVGDMIGKESV